jgi:serine protease Do
MIERSEAVSTAGASTRKSPLARRAILLASAVGLGIFVLLGESIADREFASPAWAVSPYPGETVVRPGGFADVVAKVKPAVISVSVKIDGAGGLVEDDEDENPNPPGSGLDRFFRHFGAPNTPHGRQQGQRTLVGQGSGFFISADGYAVTCNHVVDDAESVDVTTNDGTTHHARVIGTDPKSDLALIKVDGANLPYVEFADKAPRIGDWALAVGNPFGLGGTVTHGIVSANDRDIGEGPYDDFIQLDAPINKGNSGGPTFNIDGNVIGVNTAIYSPSGGSVGIGFAIPADTAKAVIAQLKDKGRVTRGWIGVQVSDINIADSDGLTKAAGALVNEARPDTPAGKAGVAAGDVITTLDGTSVKDSRDLARKVGSMAPGSSVNLSIRRNKQETTLTVTLGQLPNERKVSSGTEE